MSCFRVEDQDDLLPILERQTTKLRELYGDFCVAEIIEYPGTDDRKTIVCEVCEERYGPPTQVQN